MKLTDTQLVLLSAASQREDGGIEIGPNLKGSASRRVLGKLLTEHLIVETPAQGSLPVWRRDEDKGPLALRITDRGLAAIGGRPGCRGGGRRNPPAKAWGQRPIRPGCAPGQGSPPADR